MTLWRTGSTRAGRSGRHRGVFLRVGGVLEPVRAADGEAADVEERFKMAASCIVASTTPPPAQVAGASRSMAVGTPAPVSTGVPGTSTSAAAAAAAAAAASSASTSTGRRDDDDDDDEY